MPTSHADLDAWRSLPIKQQPQWPDADRVAEVSAQISALPPLVFAGEVDNLRERLAPQFDRDPQAFVQGLLIRYDPGAGIGWHRDRPQYGEVMGLSLGNPATLRLRRRLPEGGFERRSVELPPRSLYLLSGEVRSAWEHSIAPMEVTRRSITLRTLRADA